MRRWLATLTLLASVLFLTGAGPGQEPIQTPAPAVDPELGVPLGAGLVSLATDEAVEIDGHMEALWEQAPALAVPLHLGLHGSEPAGTIELRSLHDSEQVYLLARWDAPEPGGEPDTWRNLLTVHWRLVDPGLVSGAETGSEGLACTVACHTVTADGRGRLVGMRSETIPPGLDDDLPSGGGWEDGEWTAEWSRPRLSTSPYDQHLTDSDQDYRFFVKLFQAVENRVDPVSDVHTLRLER
jgi:hypothetical protein